MLDGIDGDVVLVGHSYGGVVITDAGVHPAVRHLVYVAAFAVDADESAANAVVDEAAAAAIEFPKPGLPDAMQFHDDGMCTLAPEGVAAFLYNDCDPATQQWATERVGAQPMVTLRRSRPRAVAWRERPSTYVLCEKDLGVPASLQAILARRCTHDRGAARPTIRRSPAGPTSSPRSSSISRRLIHRAESARSRVARPAQARGGVTRREAGALDVARRR